MPSLVLEGGSFRALFSAGIMDALLDSDIMFPYCIGVSAGISNCYSYISKQKSRNINVMEKYRNDKRYMGIKNILREGSLFGLKFIFEDIPNKLELYDYDTFRKFDGTMVVGVSNAITGKAEYFNGLDVNEKADIIKATCAIPVLFPAIKIGESKYYDGGLCDPIPIRKAILDGNSKHLIILTNAKGYKLKNEKINILVARFLKKKYPKIIKSLLSRHINYNETLEFCEKLEQEGKAIILRPSADKILKSFEKNIKKIRLTYEDGYNMTMLRLDEIKKLFE